MYRLSQRSQVNGDENALTAAIRCARAIGKELVDLTLSNPTRAGLDYSAYDRVLGGPAWPDWAAHSKIDSGYQPEALGLPSAREALVEGWPGARADRLLLLPSSSEAYQFLFTLLGDPGDEVLAPEPSYPLLSHLAQYAGIRLVPYRLAYDGAWHVDLDSVRRAVTQRARALLWVSPHNPTGWCPSALELERLAQLGLPLICDEVFRHYPARGAAPLASALARTDALTFCIDGLSKSAGLPQAKLSWLAVSGPEEAARPAFDRLAWMADTHLSVASRVQSSLPGLLSAAPSFRAPLLARLHDHRRLLETQLRGTAATPLTSEGGWYAVLRLPALLSDEQWALSLLERHGVITHPGHFYDFDGTSPHLVLSLLPPRATFTRGLRALRSCVEDLA